MAIVKIAFVLDSTASMGPWIRAAKNKIGDIVDSVKIDHPEASVDIALVSYRDYGDLVRFRLVDFTTPQAVMMALRNVHAQGGDDEAEDVANALQRTSQLNWEGGDVCMIFHIADAPAHGLAFHTIDISDRFPQGDPDGVDPRDEIRSMCDRHISYTFVKITSATDTMLDAFYNVWMSPIGFKVIDLRPQAFGRGATDDTSDLLSPEVSRAVSQAIDQHTFWRGM